MITAKNETTRALFCLIYNQYLKVLIANQCKMLIKVLVSSCLCRVFCRASSGDGGAAAAGGSVWRNGALRLPGPRQTRSLGDVATQRPAPVPIAAPPPDLQDAPRL